MGQVSLLNDPLPFGFPLGGRCPKPLAYTRSPGALFAVPGPRGVTYALNGTSQQLKRPLSEVKIAWNTGVTMIDPNVTVLVALSNYMSDVVTRELREKSGDTYSPEVTYKPDRCSGIFNVIITSSKSPSAVEKRVLQTVDLLKPTLARRSLRISRIGWR